MVQVGRDRNLASFFGRSIKSLSPLPDEKVVALMFTLAFLILAQLFFKKNSFISKFLSQM